VHISTLPLGYIIHAGDIRRYLLIKRILKEGCSCGSNVFEAYENVICSKCGKIHYKYKRDPKSITTQHMSITYLMSKKKKRFQINYTTDVPVEDLYDFMSKPVPKDFLKYTNIKKIDIDSDVKWRNELKSFLRTNVEILEKKFPEYINFKIEFSSGLIIREIIEFRPFKEYTEVNIKHIFSKRVAELVEKKNIRNNIENIVKYFSNKHHRNYELAFLYDNEPITH
jgi:hypothetical protein